MTKNVTRNELIQFIYGELSFEQTAKLYEQIGKTPSLEEDLNALVDLKNELNQVKLNPSKSVVDNILNFSASQNGIEAH